MTISPDEAKDLYAESSVADYVPEIVTVTFTKGGDGRATCYNLPVEKISGTNQVYADALWQVAKRLGLPDHYLAEIRRA